MGGLEPEVRWVVGLLLALVVGCSETQTVSARDAADANDTGGTLAARSENERALLRQVAGLPSGSARPVGAASVTADAPYTAASGRTCRALHITQPGAKASSSRLACTDGKAWFFVPDVFGGPGTSATE